MTELVFILDRSGSMSGLEKDTIGGFNSMLEKQRKEPGDAVVSTVLFDNDTEVIHDRVVIADIPNLTDKEYFVRGCTALLDAVGGAIHHIGNVHKYARKEDVPEKTLFIITTDGMENASHRYTYNKVRYMIERQKEPEAITAFLEGDSFEDVIRTAVSLGGDCDTLTAIAGSIAEGFYGVPAELKEECYKRLPEPLLKVLETFEEYLDQNVAMK